MSTVAGGSPSLDQRVWSAYRGELQKLRAQAALRLVLVLVVAGPFAFGALLRIQSGTPSDAIFGTYVHASGFAVSLVVLSFAGNWGIPIIAGLVAGDMFAGEDRHNTWKSILTRSCSLGDLFLAKVLAAASAVMALVTITGAASIAAGLIFTGFHPFVDLSGAQIPAAHALWLTAIAWLVCLVPALCFTGIALLCSVASRNGIVGVVGPLVVGLATLLLNLIGRGAWVHLLLAGATFTNLFGLFAAPAFLGPLAVTLAAGLLWAGGTVVLAWMVLRRRDFLTGAADATAARGAGWRAPARLALGVALAVAVLALATNLGPVAVTRGRVQRSVAGTFSNASLLQQRLIGRIPPATARLLVAPYCIRRGTASRGPGDWTCDVYVYLPQPKAVPFQRTNVEYDVSVTSNGCFKAQSPPNFIGGQTLTTRSGASTTNPLFVVYGCFNTL